MKQKVLIFLAIIILSFSFAALKEVKADSEDNVYGWAWSENIGWISFNCDNPELLSCDTSNYGVNIDSAGNFSGYAWAGGGENVNGSLAPTIGWISFNEADLVGCPSGQCEAKLNLQSKNVSGWARALAYGGGWDGWIKLRDLGYGVTLDATLDPSEFKGWAWGSDVIGWISFNCSDEGVCGVSDYKVKSIISGSPDEPIGLDESWGCCQGIPNVAKRTRLTLDWIYSDPGGNPQEAYEIWIDQSSDFSNPKFNHVVDPGSCAGPDCSYAVDLAVDDDPPDWFSKLNWTTTYWWKVKVKNSDNVWSDFSSPKSFVTPNRASPFVSFTVEPENPRTGEEVTFIDESKCYLSDDSEYDCDTGGGQIRYKWDFDYTGTMDEDDTTKGDTTHTYSNLGSYTIRLQVTDTGVGLGLGVWYKDEDIGLQLPLPVWQEITPF